MPSIYDRSTRELLAAATRELTPPFTADEIVRWFEERYPKLKKSNVTAHVRFLTANDRNRQHHAFLGGQEPSLFHIDDGRFVPYDRSVHGEWNAQGQQVTGVAEALDGFSPPVPFNGDEVRSAPDGSGVHVVFDHEGAVAYIGRSGRTKQRLQQHLSGDREGSALRAAVGRLLSGKGSEDVDEGSITTWIEGCTVSWLEAPPDQTQGIKGRLVADLAPALNTLQPPPAATVWWVNQQNPAELSEGYAFAPNDRSAGHQRVEEMRPGDVVLHNRDRQIIAAGVVTSAPELARVEYRLGEPADGQRVTVGYSPLERPIRLAEVVPPIDDCSLIASDGALSRVYAVRLSPATAARFASEFADRWPVGIFVGQPDRVDEEPKDLPGLIARWRSDTKYPTARDEKLRSDRPEMAPHLTEDGLAALASEPTSARTFFNRFAATAYGSPGPQSIFNKSIQDDTVLLRSIEAVRHLLHGPGDVGDRIDDVLDRSDLAVPGLKEALITKLLAIHDPGRWFPTYVSTGAKGKLRAIEILGLETPPATASVGERVVATNDTLNEALTPHLGDDAWGKQAFCFWLVKRDAAEPAPLAAAPQGASLAELADRLYVPETFLRRAIRLLQDRHQVVFYGPPGTGKTYVARELADHVAGTGEVMKVQFHPSYAYEDFVEGYRPRVKDGAATFELVDGPLKELALIAEERPDESHVLLIDEINRGNVAKILGELFFLLEYRDEEMRLQYSATPFRLPENLFIIATMNTADRSIALVDAALRRRFHFVPFFPDAPPVKGLLRRWLTDHRPEMVWVADLVDRVNGMLDDRHLAIGPSHFLRKDLDEEWLDLVWEHSVLPYLAEQFFGDEDRLVPFGLTQLRSAMAAESPSAPDEDQSGDADAGAAPDDVDPPAPS